MGENTRQKHSTLLHDPGPAKEEEPVAKNNRNADRILPHTKKKARTERTKRNKNKIMICFFFPL